MSTDIALATVARVTEMENMDAHPIPGTISLKRRIFIVAHSQKVGLVVLLILLLVGLYFFAWREMRFFLVPSGSMEPTLYPEDMIITLSQREYRRGDIVVFPEEGEFIVKRIIALPDDSVSVADGALFLNGKYASEPYIFEAMNYFIETPITIPENRFFYLGDNRNASDDSSLEVVAAPPGQNNKGPRLGHIDDIIGKVVFRYYPYSRFGKIRSYPLVNIAGQ